MRSKLFVLEYNTKVIFNYNKNNRKLNKLDGVEKFLDTTTLTFGWVFLNPNANKILAYLL